MYSDMHVFTVMRVSASGRTFWCTEDHYRRTDTNGWCDTGQTYDFTPDPEGEEVEVRWTTKGWKQRGKPTRFRLGVRSKYHDHSF